MTSKQIVREVLARHREQPSVGLDITFPIYWQMDEDLGHAIEVELKAHGSWECMRATPSLGDHIPAKTGLYMFVFRSHIELSLDGNSGHRPLWVLYVGRAGSHESTKTLRDRYKGEYAKYVGGDLEQLWGEGQPKGRVENLKRYLSIWPIEYWWLVIDDRSKIPHLEDRLIKLLAPPLNRNGRLRVKTGVPEPAFKVP